MKKRIPLIAAAVILVLITVIFAVNGDKFKLKLAERLNHITVERKEIGGTSFIEVNAYTDEAKPLVFFQHGLSGGADDIQLLGEVLATQGYRVILVDALEFGKNATGKEQNIPDIILETRSWYDEILDYYMDAGKLQDNKFALAGMSLGGMIDYAYLTDGKYDPTCVIALYTTPDWTDLDDVDVFYYLVKNGDVAGYATDPNLFDEIHDKYTQNSPSENADKIFRMPLLTINGDADQIMGVPDLDSLIKKAGRNVAVEPKQIVREGQVHELAEGDSEEIIAFLEQYLKNE